jgi:hypothetical protein
MKILKFLVFSVVVSVGLTNDLMAEVRYSWPHFGGVLVFKTRPSPEVFQKLSKTAQKFRFQLKPLAWDKSTHFFVSPDSLTSNKWVSSFCSLLNKDKKAFQIQSCERNLMLFPAQEEEKHNGVSKQDIEALGIEVAEEKCIILEHSQMGAGLRAQNNTEAFGDATLSHFWAQEYVGLDLANQYMGKLKAGTADEKVAPQAVSVQILDSSEGDHGKNVKHVMISPTLGSCAGIWCRAESFKGFEKNSTFFDLTQGANDVKTYNAQFLSALSKIKNGEIKTDVMNVSMTGIQPETMKAISELTYAKNVIPVIAAGNTLLFDSAEELAKETLATQDALVVGSLSPDGGISDFSIQGRSVAILSPSDRFLSSIEAFGGTSGSAPLVAGVAAQIRSLLPGLELQGVIALLQNTSLPTENSFYEPKNQGIGTLNAFAALKFAAKVSEACSLVQDKTQKRSCWLKEISKIKKREQKFDSDLVKEANELFGCGENRKKKEKNNVANRCRDKQEIFKKIRQEAYLNPDVAPYWELLSCVHEKIAFPKNAEFYASLAERGWPPEEPSQTRKRLLQKYIQQIESEKEKPTELTSRAYLALAALSPEGRKKLTGYAKKVLEQSQIQSGNTEAIYAWTDQTFGYYHALRNAAGSEPAATFEAIKELDIILPILLEGSLGTKSFQDPSGPLFDAHMVAKDRSGIKSDLRDLWEKNKNFDLMIPILNRMEPKDRLGSIRLFSQKFSQVSEEKKFSLIFDELPFFTTNWDIDSKAKLFGHLVDFLPDLDTDKLGVWNESNLEYLDDTLSGFLKVFEDIKVVNPEAFKKAEKQVAEWKAKLKDLAEQVRKNEKLAAFQKEHAGKKTEELLKLIQDKEFMSNLSKEESFEFFTMVQNVEDIRSGYPNPKFQEYINNLLIKTPSKHFVDFVTGQKIDNFARLDSSVQYTWIKQNPKLAVEYFLKNKLNVVNDYINKVSGLLLNLVMKENLDFRSPVLRAQFLELLENNNSPAFKAIALGLFAKYFELRKAFPQEHERLKQSFDSLLKEVDPQDLSRIDRYLLDLAPGSSEILESLLNHLEKAILERDEDKEEFLARMLQEKCESFLLHFENSPNFVELVQKVNSVLEQRKADTKNKLTQARVSTLWKAIITKDPTLAGRDKNLDGGIGFSLIYGLGVHSSELSAVAADFAVEKFVENAETMYHIDGPYSYLPIDLNNHIYRDRILKTLKAKAAQLEAKILDVQKYNDDPNRVRESLPRKSNFEWAEQLKYLVTYLYINGDRSELTEKVLKKELESLSPVAILALTKANKPEFKKYRLKFFESLNTADEGTNWFSATGYKISEVWPIFSKFLEADELGPQEKEILGKLIAKWSVEKDSPTIEFLSKQAKLAVAPDDETRFKLFFEEKGPTERSWFSVSQNLGKFPRAINGIKSSLEQTIISEERAFSGHWDDFRRWIWDYPAEAKTVIESLNLPVERQEAQERLLKFLKEDERQRALMKN